MKSLMTAFVLVVLAGSVAFAEGEKTQASPSAEAALTTITGKDKKARKKKVEMCAECGKPESQCDCPGHGNDPEKKKAEQTGK